MKRFAVVILNWNGEKLLKQFLPTVVKNTPKDLAEIIVADNGSTDDSLSYVKESFPEESVKIIRLDRNYGFAEGYNKALEQVDNEFVVLLNSDVAVSEGWLNEPLRILDSQPDVAAVQPKILSERNHEYFEYAGAAGGLMDMYGYPYCHGRILGKVEKDCGQYDTEVYIFWATGACMIIRNAVYKKVGGLDSEFFAHQEEIDLCWRLRSRGYRIVYAPSSVVYHVGGGMLSYESPRKTFLNFRNNLLMLYKNLPENRLNKVMRVRFVLDYMAAIKFLLTGHIANAKAVWEARREYKRMLPSFVSKREENLRLAVTEDIPEMKKTSLLFNYYLGRKRNL
jgi:hypothetical protein